MERYFDIAIAGAGAAGLAAAITAKTVSPEMSVAIFEKKEEAAKKLRASGNGRGNLSNSGCEAFEEALRFFADSGIAVRIDDEGRIYPYSEEAGAVAEALVKRALDMGAELLLDSEVKGVEADPDGGFRLFISGKNGDMSLKCGKLLIATGGKSFAAYGSTGDGYRFARSLGHRVTPLVPALTAIEVKEDLRKLKGVRTKGVVSLFDRGCLSFKEAGEIQFREDSLSGICVMDLSSFLPAAETGNAEKAFEGLRIAINLAPDFDSSGLMDFLRAQRTDGRRTAADVLRTIVKEPLIHEILKRAGISEDRLSSELSAEDFLKIANGVRNFSLTPCGRKGWKEAQVTKGGVAMEEICESTSESLIEQGLYFAGEVLDYDGPCGGYNLHNAWLTGIKAGRAMGRDRSGKQRGKDRKIGNVQVTSDKA